VLLLNLPWLALPVLTIIRMARAHPFSELVPGIPVAATAAARPGPPGPAGQAGG
jgi:hypothetical protein